MGVAQKLRILVVDDSVQIREFMRVKLEELADDSTPFQVEFADSGEAAVARVQGSAYDLIFLDVVMPGMDGYEACERIKQVRPARVAMLTARSSGTDFSRGRDAGCDHYLTKPPNEVDLRTIVRLAVLKKAAGR